MGVDLSWILEGLKKPGKTRAGIASAMGVSAGQVTRILQGKRHLRAKDIEAIAYYLGVAPTLNVFTPTAPKGDRQNSEFELLRIAAAAALHALRNPEIDDASARAFARSILAERLHAITASKPER